MKKIIFGLGVIFLALIIILNIIYTTQIDAGEHVTINFNSLIYILGLIVVGLAIFFVSKLIDKHLFNDTEKKSKHEIRVILFAISIVAYIAFMIVWNIVVHPAIVGDSIHICNLAQTFYTDNPYLYLQGNTYLGLPLYDYMQAYPQQIALAFVFSIIFHIINFELMYLLRVFNILCILIMVIALYKITNQLSKTYKINKVLMLVLTLTFLTIPMLSTFIYGDIPSLAFCLLAVYFMMKYTETKKIRYPIFATIFTMIAYMMRMNSLIFIIATVIYLLLSLFKGCLKKSWKENVTNIFVIILYVAISILPTSLVQGYYSNKYDLDESKKYPTISYILMAMEEGPRGNGWYSEDIAVSAIKDPEMAREEYPQRIKERLGYFTNNPGYAFQFYLDKITSMWTENTYSAIMNNTLEDDTPINNLKTPLTFYQKALLLVTFTCALIVLVQNRKNLSAEVIFLLTIFIGGFMFHILWEAKSRYIIPYIVVLIPIASICIKKFNIKDWKVFREFSKSEEKA